MKRIIELISNLTALPTVSGNEQYGMDELKNLAEGYFDEIKTTPVGSFIGIVKSGKDNAPRLILDAHFDQVGMMVTNVFDDGFVSVTNIGGIDTSILQASRVIIHGKEPVLGVFASKPPHLQTPGESEEKLEIKDLYIDTGLKNSIKNKINVGDIVYYESEVTELWNGRITGKAFDDKLCIAVILRTLEKLDRKNLECDIYCVFSGGEEIGYIGAQTSAFDIDPDAVVVLDVCTAEPPDDPKLGKELHMAKGGTISYSPTTSRWLTEKLVNCAKSNGIPYQTEAEPGRTGTNAHAFQIARGGIPTAIISYPLLNMHTPCEIADLKDFELISDLLAVFVKENGGCLNA